MPIYTFRNPKTGKTKDIVQKMNEPHIYSEKGVSWERVWHSPTASIDTKIDPFSSKDFVEKTGKKRGTLGDLFDQSKEASEQRSKTLGKDTIKQESLREWGKKRGGRKHPLLTDD